VLGWVEAICAARGVPTASLDLVSARDPLATLAELGELPLDREALAAELGDLVRARGRFSGDARTIGVSGLVYQEAGATASEQLGLVLAGAAEALRVGTAQGLGASEVLGALAVALGADEDVFATIALARAARLALAKLGVAAGLTEPVRPRLLGIGSARSFTVRDAQDNLLRATLQSYGLGVGGVDLLATLPFDDAAGRSDRLARRAARNQALVLREEGHVVRVADPAGGSYYLEALTDATARAAWEVFREIERDGGLCSALSAGSVQARLARSAAARLKLHARRKRVIVGLSEFALPAEAPTKRAPKRSASESPEGSSLGLAPGEGSLRATPLVLHRDAEPFEALRDRADALAASGQRPRALLVALGEPSDHRARVGFARRFFEVGGFELGELAIDGEGAISAPHGDAVVSAADVVCLCSSDARYAQLGAPVLEALGRLGARELTLAGRPGELEAGLRAAGLVHELYLGCDAVLVLCAMLDGVEKARGGVS
jgi:methylmalonyl-CoA mutase